MARVITDYNYVDLPVEQILLIHFVCTPDIKDLIKEVFPTCFVDERHQRIFAILRDFLKKDPDHFIIDVVLREIKEKEKMTNEESANFFFGDLFSKKDSLDVHWCIKRLKILLCKRLELQRINRLAAAIDNDEINIEVEAHKLLILRRKLLSPRRPDAQELARNTANRINSETDTIRTSFKFLNDRLHGLTRPGVSSILAKPKHYKSSFVDGLIAGSVERFKYRGAIVSLEDPTEERIKRIIAPRLGYSLSDMRFKRVKIKAEEIEKVFHACFGNNLFFVDTREITKPEEAISFLNDVKPDIAAVDHVQKFEMSDMVQGLIQAVRGLEVAAARNNGHYVITSQVDDKKSQFRDDKTPQAQDAQWTSALRQSSTEMFSLYYQYQDTKNPFQKEWLKLTILASRYADAIGTIDLRINPDKAQILE